jgi:hypothetical protein
MGEPPMPQEIDRYTETGTALSRDHMNICTAMVKSSEYYD